MSDELNVSTGVPHATTRVNDAYCANPNIDSILASGFRGPVEAGPLVVSEGGRGEKVVGGFGLPESTIVGIQNGTIWYIVGWGCYCRCHFPIPLVDECVNRGIPMTDCNTKVSMIDDTTSTSLPRVTARCRTSAVGRRMPSSTGRMSVATPNQTSRG